MPAGLSGLLDHDNERGNIASCHAGQVGLQDKLPVFPAGDCRC